MTESRHLLFEVLEDLGIEYLFGVEGTTELPLIDGCAAFPGVKYVQVLHENIALGAAMGYGRMTGKPGVVVVHVTPGVAHALANLYNAWRAQIPLVFIGGQQSSELVTQEPLLWSNTVELTRQFTKWSHELKNVYELPLVLQRAFKEAMAEPQGPVFLSMPVDLTIQETNLKAYPVTRIGSRICGDMNEIDKAADLLAKAKNPGIVTGDGCGLSGAWSELLELANQIGAAVHNESLSTIMNYPPLDYHWQNELPEDADGMRTTLGQYDVVLLCGFSSQAPMTVFDGGPPLIPDSVTKIYLSNNPWEIGKNFPGAAAIQGDIRTSLGPLMDAIAAKNPDQDAIASRNLALAKVYDQLLTDWEQYIIKVRDSKPISPALIAYELGQLQPKGLIYVDEANTATGPLLRLLPYQDPLSYYSGKGDALGYSMASAIGMKLAAPHRTIVNVAGDGAALFYPQAYWTAAKYNLPILFIVLNNHEYKTLKQGLEAMHKFWHEVTEPPGLDIRNPNLDFTAIAAAFGVGGERIEDPKDIRAALERGLSAGKPYLLEFLIEGKVDDTWPTG